jgi:hypothetical protein
MADPREIRFMVQDITVDIGEDGGELTIVQSDPPVYKINGEDATWQEAYRWIKHWHDLRDAYSVVHTSDAYEPCTCTPCQWARKADG